mmetsp:Transcript_25353/g.84719  ORF Transcript_25353/g.84719 Transcript_25353/m.84719 type:complete len:224 (+) Transcript_25353:742-1413(+)
MCSSKTVFLLANAAGHVQPRRVPRRPHRCYERQALLKSRAGRLEIHGRDAAGHGICGLVVDICCLNLWKVPGRCPVVEGQYLPSLVHRQIHRPVLARRDHDLEGVARVDDVSPRAVKARRGDVGPLDGVGEAAYIRCAAVAVATAVEFEATVRVQSRLEGICIGLHDIHLQAAPGAGLDVAVIWARARIRHCREVESSEDAAADIAEVNRVPQGLAQEIEPLV